MEVGREVVYEHGHGVLFLSVRHGLSRLVIRRCRVWSEVARSRFFSDTLNPIAQRFKHGRQNGRCIASYKLREVSDRVVIGRKRLKSVQRGILGNENASAAITATSFGYKACCRIDHAGGSDGKKHIGSAQDAGIQSRPCGCSPKSTTSVRTDQPEALQAGHTFPSL